MGGARLHGERSHGQLIMIVGNPTRAYETETDQQSPRPLSGHREPLLSGQRRPEEGREGGYGLIGGLAIHTWASFIVQKVTCGGAQTFRMQPEQ